MDDKDENKKLFDDAMKAMDVLDSNVQNMIREEAKKWVSSMTDEYNRRYFHGRKSEDIDYSDYIVYLRDWKRQMDAKVINSPL